MSIFTTNSKEREKNMSDKPKDFTKYIPKKRKRLIISAGRSPKRRKISNSSNMSVSLVTGSSDLSTLMIQYSIGRQLSQIDLDPNFTNIINQITGSNPNLPRPICPPPEKEDDAKENTRKEDLCKICLQRRRCVIIEDCKHIDFCITCINRLLVDESGSTMRNIHCPTCRKKIIIGASKVYL